MPELVCAADDPRWLDERRAGVTATDITAITGISPYESAYSLYWKKLGHIPDAHEDSDRLRLGRDLEPLIMARWCEVNPDAAYSLIPALWRSDARPWQMATPDAVLYDGAAKPGTGREIDPAPAIGVLEVKSWADADRAAWDDQPPPRVRAQVLWQMDTLDVATGHVGVLFLPSGEFRSYVIEHRADLDCAYYRNVTDDGACEVCRDIDLMRTAGAEFMARIRHELPPPSPDASSATLAALKARFADPRKTKQAEIDALLWADWADWKDAEDAAENLRKGIEVKIREQAGDAGILTVAGIPVARRTVSIVKAHWRKEGRRDSITRIKNGETDAGA